MILNGARGAPYGLWTCPENHVRIGSFEPGRVRPAHAEWNFDSGISDRAGCLWGSSDWCARRTLLFAYLLGKPGRVRIAHAERCIGPEHRFESDAWIGIGEWCARHTLRFVDLPGKPRADWQLRAAKVAERCIGSEYWLDGAFARGPANGAHGAPYGLATCPESRMGLGSPGIPVGAQRARGTVHRLTRTGLGLACVRIDEWCARRTLRFICGGAG